MGDLAKTYSDLLALLPEASEIRVRWGYDEDGLPDYVDGIRVFGHDGQILGELDSDAIENGPQELHIQDGSTLVDRLHAAVNVLGWADPFAFSEQDGETVMPLPSPRHVPDAPPVG